MKQRSMSQMEKQGKFRAREFNEVKISNMPATEFEVMIMKIFT